MRNDRVWTVEIMFTEDEDHTRADAVLRGHRREYSGWGRARRNPSDPDVPVIGEELAAARALDDLAQHLLRDAASTIGAIEGHPVTLNA